MRKYRDLKRDVRFVYSNTFVCKILYASEVVFTIMVLKID